MSNLEIMNIVVVLAQFACIHGEENPIERSEDGPAPPEKIFMKTY